MLKNFGTHPLADYTHTKPGGLLLLVGTLSAVVFSELCTAAMSWLFLGRVDAGYMITGAATAFLVSLLVIPYLIRSIKQQELKLLQLGQDADRIKLEAAEKMHDMTMFLQATQGIAHVGGWKVNLDTSELVATEEAHRLIEHPFEQPVKELDHGISFFAPEYQSILQAQLKESWEKGTPFTREFEIISDGGRRLWAELRCIGRVTDDQGTFLVGTIQDIDELKRLRTTLENQVTFSQLVINAEIDGIAVCHAVSEPPYVRFSVWNPSVESLTGYSMQEINILGWYQSIYVEPEVQERAKLRMARMRQGEHLEREEWLITRKDGAQRLVQISTATVAEDHDGVHVLAVMRDITESRQNQRRLEQALVEQKAMLENELVGIVRVARRTILWANPAFELMLGYRQGELLNMPTRQCFTSEASYLELGAAAYPILAAGNVYRAQIEQVRKNGEHIWVDISGAMLDSQTGESLWAFIDITELKRAEEELQRHRLHLEELVFSRTSELAAARDAAEAANRAKSVFLATMSHELRTPMNAIMGMTSLALRRSTDPKLIEYLGKSEKASRHLLAVINDILDISKIEADRLCLEERNFSLEQVMDESLRMQEEAARYKGLQLSREISAGLPDELCGDSLRLKQILLNFLSNAIKFSERGEIKMAAQVLEEDSHSLLLRIEVTDQGIGVSPEHQSRLFRAFTQADDSATRKYGGTGLGLVISKRIALLMGGDVGVISQEGAGSTFWATARLKRASAKPASVPSPAAESPQVSLARCFSGSRILVVEDDPVNQEVEVFLLEDVGLVAEVVSNGQEAVEKAGHGNFALILMDVRLPVMDGLAATRAIRQLPGLATVPILAMTANAFDEDRENCLAAGMNAHIGKPFELEPFYSTVLYWLTKSAVGK